MNTMELVHFASTTERTSQRSPRPSSAPFHSELIHSTRHAILCARQYLLGEQRSDGSWFGLQHCDVSLASQLVFLRTYLGSEEFELVEQAVATILSEQRPDGGWSLVPGGPTDLSTSVQAYLALKLAGADCIVDGRLSRARETIRSLGGADAADLPTRFFLALFGQVGHDCCPLVCPASPPHRGTGAAVLAALAVVRSRRAVCDVGMEHGVRELFIKPSSDWPRTPPGCSLRAAAPSILETMWRLGEKLGCTPLRTHALRRAESQALRRLHETSVARLNFTELVGHFIALHAMGYSEASAERQACQQRLREMLVSDEESDTVRPQICNQSVGDTTIALRALAASGTTAAHPCIAAGKKWLFRQRQSTSKLSAADLADLLGVLGNEKYHKHELENALPPDIGPYRGSLGRRHSRHRRDRSMRLERVIASIVQHLLRTQQCDGGWANVGDESTPDATSVVLETLVRHTGEAVAAAAQQAADYLRHMQRPEGSWDSACGVQFVHGTSLAVRGLVAAGVSPNDDAVAAGINWLLMHQQPSGGWGEMPPALTTMGQSNRDEFVPGDATASQTAWALLALVAAGRASSPAARRAVSFLLDTQQNDGRWCETQFVLRDAASGRCYRSSLHTTAAPLRALSRWAVVAPVQADTGEKVSFRVVGAAID